MYQIKSEKIRENTELQMERNRDYLQIKNQLGIADKEDILTKARNHYETIPRKKRAMIFNDLIVERYLNFQEMKEASLKVLVHLSFLFMSYPEKKNNFGFKVSNLSVEKKIFYEFASSFEESFTLEHFFKVEEDSMIRRAFVNYNSDYPSISRGEYLMLFREYNEVSKKKYNFSIYDNYLYIANITSGRNSGWLSEKKLKNFFRGSGLEINEINSLFFDISILNKDDIQFLEIQTKMLGKLGIKYEQGYYIPQTWFIFENLFNYLAENKKEDATEILEGYAQRLFSSFFGKSNVSLNNYDKGRNEQDIIISLEDTILLVECKSNNFTRISDDDLRTEEKLQNTFNSAIQYGANQCLRAEKYIKDNDPAEYYDSNKKRGRNKILEINKGSEKTILKIVVLLNDYLNLAESSNQFLEESTKNVWVVNMFALEKILWKLGNVSDFIEYAIHRCSNIQTIEARTSDELVQLGYFISPIFKNFIPQNNMFATVSAGNNFANWANEYEVSKDLNEFNYWVNYQLAKGNYSKKQIEKICNVKIDKI